MPLVFMVPNPNVVCSREARRRSPGATGPAPDLCAAPISGRRRARPGGSSSNSLNLHPNQICISNGNPVSVAVSQLGSQIVPEQFTFSVSVGATGVIEFGARNTICYLQIPMVFLPLHAEQQSQVFGTEAHVQLSAGDSMAIRLIPVLSGGLPKACFARWAIWPPSR